MRNYIPVAFALALPFFAGCNSSSKTPANVYEEGRDLMHFGARLVWTTQQLAEYGDSALAISVLDDAQECLAKSRDYMKEALQKDPTLRSLYVNEHHGFSFSDSAYYASIEAEAKSLGKSLESHRRVLDPETYHEDAGSE